MTEERVRRWVEGYVKAWNSNEAADITALFTEDGRYLTEPHAEPWEGHDEIVRKWLESKDRPGETTFEYEVRAVDGDLAIVKGVTTYKEPRRLYSNLWEIEFAPDGRASKFVEWWMKR